MFAATFLGLLAGYPVALTLAGVALLFALGGMLTGAFNPSDLGFLPNRLFFDDIYYVAYSQDGSVFPQQDYLGYLGKKYCLSFGLDCVSAFPYLRTSEKDKHTFEFDGHFNEAGARKIGQGVAWQLFGVMR